MKNTYLLIFTLLSFVFCKAQKADFVVAGDGSGNFKTVQEAFNAVPDFRKEVTLIYIKKGVYKEKLVLAGSKLLVHITGEENGKTILTFDDYNGKKNRFGEPIGTSGSSSFYIFGNGFRAENITFENSSGPVGQAVAVQVAADQAAFFNCRFLGFQDTLYPFGYGARQYYKNCYIEGTTDFIFGAATAVFEDCEIFSKAGGNYIAAASTPDTVTHGFVFIRCKLTGNAPAGTVYLGRPWRPFAKTVYLNSYFGAHIAPAGWHNWNKPVAEKTAYYAEFGNHGPGAGKENKRVQWAHALTPAEAAAYTTSNIFRGWDPGTHSDQ